MGKDGQRVIGRMNRQILAPCVLDAVPGRGFAFGDLTPRWVFSYFAVFLVLVLFVMPEKIERSQTSGAISFVGKRLNLPV